jgi:hypothetical protein
MGVGKMNVKQLVEKLRNFPQEMEVMALSEFDQANEINTVGLSKECYWNNVNDKDKEIVSLS